ncbi:MAG: hypothetical protein M3220_02505 [Chloroflexota bacterium]|nr:hypothetical protein [Chloroflexota bacterium]
MSHDLSSGWTIDIGCAIYHFEHTPADIAWQRLELREHPFVVETINRTIATADPNHLHLNQYFAWSLPEAIALAARVEIDAQSVAEEVVEIRPATPEEVEEYTRVWNYFSNSMPAAIPDKVHHE